MFVFIILERRWAIAIAITVLVSLYCISFVLFYVYRQFLCRKLLAIAREYRTPVESSWCIMLVVAVGFQRIYITFFLCVCFLLCCPFCCDYCCSSIVSIYLYYSTYTYSIYILYDNNYNDALLFLLESFILLSFLRICCCCRSSWWH